MSRARAAGLEHLVVIGLWAVLFPPLRRFDRMDEAEEVQQEGAEAPD